MDCLGGDHEHPVPLQLESFHNPARDPLPERLASVPAAGDMHA